MRTPLIRPLAPAIVALTIAACSRDNTAPAKTPDTSPSTATTAATTRAACAMVTAEEMSGIVGTKLSAESGDSTATCMYQPAEGSSPHVELTVDWGGGPAALTASSLLSRREPGISNPLDGLGDEASSIGPALWVRVGEDLVTLTLWGIEDDIPAAKLIITTMRPRMGPSAQAKSGNTSSSDEAAKAGAIVSGLLDRLSSANEGARTSESGDTGAASQSAGAPIADDASYGPAKGSAIRIPLVAGLTLVGAEQEPGRGDYEPIVTITAVTTDAVSTTFSTTLPEGRRLRVERAVSRDDLQRARAFRSWYEDGDPPRFAGATSFGMSATVLNDLKTKGQADVVRLAPHENSLIALAQQFAGGNATPPRQEGTLRRVEAYAVAFPVLVNDTAIELPAIHARGMFNGAAIDFHVLDDPDNPLLLRLAGGSAGRIVRITFPTLAATPIEERLKTQSRVELHGIYFDFGKDTIRPESEPVLRDIAAALTHNPSWKITIEGHTDNIGGEAANLDLSHRRADAVKKALVERFRVPAATLATNGFGAARPSATNDTLSGRARNRRVELVRQ